MFIKASTFLGSMTLPSLDTVKPKMVLENTMNSPFVYVQTNTKLFTFKKTFLQLLKVSDKSLKNHKFIKKKRHEYINVLPSNRWVVHF
jgi:hypothetical protein